MVTRGVPPQLRQGAATFHAARSFEFPIHSWKVYEPPRTAPPTIFKKKNRFQRLKGGEAGTAAEAL